MHNIVKAVMINESDKTPKSPNDPDELMFGKGFVKDSALHEAARKFDLQQLQALLRSNHCDPNFKDEQGRNALHILLSDSFRGHLNEDAMLECLKVLACHCDANEKDNQGETPLSWAVYHQFNSCASYLIKCGADTAVRTPKFRQTHKLACTIAESMPAVMIEILNSGVKLEYKNEQPEVQLDWSPLLQYSDQDDLEKFGLKRHKFKAFRETSFLYSLMDAPFSIRNTYLSHPLVAAFVALKSKAISRNLWWFYLIMVLYPLLYMVFIYFLYFHRCKFDLEEDEEDEAVNCTTRLALSKSQKLAHALNEIHRKHSQLCEITAPISVAAYLLGLIVAGFFALELYMQLRIDMQHFRSWRTWVIRVSLVIMAVTLWPAMQFNNLYDISWQYPIAALGTFFAWVMFLIHMEFVPQVKVYLEMLVAILISVLKITLLFLPLLIGFYMGFNLMFFKSTKIMSFILMTVDVGSDEYEEMIDNNARDDRLWFTFMANVFGVGFIIVVAIVFMNFLLGASINDIQELKDKAKVMSLSNQIKRFFLIDLVFSSRFSVVSHKEMAERKCWFRYSPCSSKCQLPNHIRREIIELLKLRQKNKNQKGIDE